MATFEEVHHFRVTGRRTLVDNGYDLITAEKGVLIREIQEVANGWDEEFLINFEFWIAKVLPTPEAREECGISPTDERVHSKQQLFAWVHTKTWEHGYALQDVLLKWERGEYPGQGQGIDPKHIIKEKPTALEI